MSDWQKVKRFNHNANQKRLSVLQQLANGSIKPEQADRILSNHTVTRLPRRQISERRCQVTQGGLLAVYGFSPKPIVLFENQWHRFLEYMPTVSQYLTEHASELRKPPVEMKLKKEDTSSEESSSEEEDE